MAKKFKLQSVLNYRRTLEDQARQQLSSSQQQKNQLELELHQHQFALQQLDSELKERQLEGLSIAEIDLFEAQIDHRRRLMVALQQRLEELERQIQQEREELLAAAREKQVMEKLKEKQEEEFRREQARLERNLLDEISLRNKGEQS